MDEHEVLYQTLIILTDTLKNNDIKEALFKELTQHPNFNWDKFLTISFKQKVAGLVFKNLQLLHLSELVPFRIYNVFRHFYYGNQARNKILFDNLFELISIFNDENIDVRPLKGSVLIPLVYQDYGSRVMNDIDLFIDKENISVLPEIMGKIGFIQGDYSRVTGTITNLSTEEKLMWKLKMFNLPPFRKVVSCESIDVVNVDFTFGLTYSDVRDVQKTILNKSEVIAGIKTLDRVDFFIHLCCHLYKEASNEAWIKLGQDINLIKFCDIREFFHVMLAEYDIPLFIQRVEQLNVSQPVYFALYYTQLIYPSLNIEAWINAIKIGDKSFMTALYRQGKQIVSERNSSIISLITSM